MSGPRTWRHIIKIGDLIYDDDLTFESKRDGVVDRIRKSAVLKDGIRGRELAGLIEELTETIDVEEYDDVMHDIYNLADAGKWLWLGP